MSLTDITKTNDIPIKLSYTQCPVIDSMLKCRVKGVSIATLAPDTVSMLAYCQWPSAQAHVSLQSHDSMCYIFTERMCLQIV